MLIILAYTCITFLGNPLATIFCIASNQENNMKFKENELFSLFIARQKGLPSMLEDPFSRYVLQEYI
jgi:hypothetical protein